MSNKRKKLLEEKAKNKGSLRVLYKQVGKNPRVRIIPNVQILKQAIITRKLDLIPYQNVFLVCNNQDYMKTTPINVVFDLFHISGDLLVVQINKKVREFESLSQEDIIWYSQDLINKATPTTCSNVKIPNVKKLSKVYEQTFERDMDIGNSSTTFEDRLINVLTNMQVNLIALLENQTKK